MPKTIHLKKPNRAIAQPLVSLCVMFRNDRDTLPTLLESIKGCFDEYVFVDTGATDGSAALVRKALPDAKMADFTWIDDFAAARNFTYGLATGKWRMFLDADDTLLNGQKVRDFCRIVAQKHPHVEGFFVPYDYGVDERLDTMRLVKWREGWRWVDAIHERLEFSAGKLPPNGLGRTSDFSVRHRYKTEEQKRAAIIRNGLIARREYDATTDIKYRSRLARTIAMEMKMQGQALEAIPYLTELHKHYYLFPEGRQAAADMMKVHLALFSDCRNMQNSLRRLTLGALTSLVAPHLSDPPEAKPEGWTAQRNRTEWYRAASVWVAGWTTQQNLDEALRWAKLAGPSYEAIAHHARKEYRECIAACQRGAGLEQQATHEGYVFEKGAALLAAADAADTLGMSPDVVDHLMAQCPPSLRLNPILQPVLSALRMKVDRITIVVPGTPQCFDENGGGGMLGGSEEAVLYLARTLAREPFKRNVRVFCPLPPQRLPGRDMDGIDWQDVRRFEPDAEHGSLVVWRVGQFVLQLAQLKQSGQKLLPGIGAAHLWLHDSSMAGGNYAPQIAQSVSTVECLSDFHEKKIRLETNNEGTFVRVANGIVEEDFEGFDLGERDRNRVVYSSCPTRGLIHLLRMWPRVKQAVPDAKLDIYYDWRMAELHAPEVFDEVSKAYEAVKHLDVIHHGGVDHATLHTALRRANVWAYPHFENTEVETFCISAVKAAAAGATVVTSRAGALPETARGLACFTDGPSVFEQHLIDFLQFPESKQARERKSKLALERFGWRKVAEVFNKLWTVRPPLSRPK
jgi:glycosyltransferase involved in cell wall biosynthesis